MIGYPIAHRISSVLSGTEAELAINVFGDDLATLRTAAAAVKQVLDTLPQVADAREPRDHGGHPCASVTAWMRWRVPG